MAFDGIITKCIVSELNKIIIGSKVTKIFQPDNNTIIISLYNNKKNYALNISTNADKSRLHLTTHSKPNPLSAPNFCMLLRKHLIGTKLKAISTNDLERVVEIIFTGYNELQDIVEKKLFVEIMGNFSNIIFTNQDNVIIDMLKHINTARGLSPTRHYSLPQNDKKSFVNLKSFDEFSSIVNNKEQIPEKFIGISKSFVNNIQSENLEEIYNYIKEILSLISTQKLGIKKLQKDYVIDISDCNSLNFALDDYYFEKENIDEFINHRNNLLKTVLDLLKKYSTRLTNIDKKLDECTNAEKYKLYGELITSNLYRLKEQVSEVNLENYYDNQVINIKLDDSISPQKNAEKFFNKYNKLKKTALIVEKQKTLTMQEIKYIESIVFSVESAKTLAELDDIYNELYENNLISKPKQTEKNAKKEAIFDKVQIDGFTVYVGKNNKQNEYLTFKIANKTDLWFHTQDIHGSHVILKTEGKQIPDKVIEKCAKLAVEHSKAKFSSNTPVDYTYVKNVKKPSGSKPGMVVYTNYKTIFI